MNTIRELKQQEKYKNMLKRKNKEKKIYKDKNASLQFEKHRLYIALLNREKKIERLNKGLDELEELCKTKYYEKNTTDIDSIAIAGNLYVYMYKKIKELKGEDKE